MGLSQIAIEWIDKLWPSAVGSAGSLMWLKGIWYRLIGYFFLGLYVGHHLGTFTTLVLEIPYEITRFVWGLIGVAIIQSLFSMLHNADLWGLFSDIIRKRFGS